MSLQEQELHGGTSEYVQLAHFLSFILEVSNLEKETLSPFPGSSTTNITGEKS